MKILIADDDFISRTILVTVLTELGYETVNAEDGEVAWDMLQQIDDISIAIIDWMMPGKTGIELCRELRNLDEQNIPVYVILLTYMKDPKDIATGLEAGADDYMVKPFNTEELKARIQVGVRTVNMQQKMAEYSEKMELLAKERAVQLMHADRMATIGTLTSGVAHEINNPATFISVCAQTIDEHWDSFIEEITIPVNSHADVFSKLMPAIVKDIKSGLDRIQDIVSGLKLYSHIDSKEKKSVSLTKIIDKACHFTKNRLKTISLHINVSDNIPDIQANERQLEQVIINILINSADALNEPTHIHKEKEISINVSHTEKDVILAICNNGPEIPQEEKKNIFKPFYTTKRAEKGTGLGLSICRTIIEDHSGTITVETPYTGGVCFKVVLQSQNEE